MIWSKKLLTIAVTLFGLHTLHVNAATSDPKIELEEIDHSAALAFFTPQSILDLIKKQPKSTVNEFVGSLELNLLTTYNKTLSDITDQNGYNTLHLACERGHDDVVTTLIETAYDNLKFISKPNNFGLNPLMIAVCNNRPTMVQFLVKALGQDLIKCVLLKTRTKQNVFHFAAYVGNKEIFELLVDKTTENDSKSLPTILLTPGEKGNTVLHIAMGKRRNDVTKNIYHYAYTAGKTQEVLDAKNDDGHTANDLVSCTIL